MNKLNKCDYITHILSIFPSFLENAIRNIVFDSRISHRLVVIVIFKQSSPHATKSSSLLYIDIWILHHETSSLHIQMKFALNKKERVIRVEGSSYT